MSGVQGRQSPDRRTASAVRRGSRSATPGSYRVPPRSGTSVVPTPSGTGAGLLAYNYVQLTGSVLGISNGGQITGFTVAGSTGDTSWHNSGNVNSLAVLTDGVFAVTAVLTTSSDPGSGALWMSHEYEGQFPLVAYFGQWRASGAVTAPFMPSAGGSGQMQFFYLGANSVDCDLTVTASRLM